MSCLDRFSYVRIFTKWNSFLLVLLQFSFQFKFLIDLLLGVTLPAGRGPSIQVALFMIWYAEWQFTLHQEAAGKDTLSSVNLIQLNWSTYFSLDMELVTLWPFLAISEEENLTSFIPTEFKKRHISEIPKYETMPF